MSPTEALEVHLGEYAAPFRSAMLMLSMIPPETFDDAIQRMERGEAFGCYTDPTAWMKTDWNNARDWKAFFEQCAKLRRMIPTPPNHSPGNSCTNPERP